MLIYKIIINIKMKILFILLGCNIYSILLNRLESSFKFIEKNIFTKTNKINLNSTNEIIFKTNILETTQITWFLSGGIKNSFKGAKSEASIMKSQIDNIINLKYNLNQNVNKKYICVNNDFVCLSKFVWNYVLDEKSTNTAENFIQSSQFINTTTETFDSVYVITSAFHYKRAQMMLNLIDSSRNFKWILGDLEEKDSRYWESIHINNVNVDVSNAISKLTNNLI